MPQRAKRVPPRDSPHGQTLLPSTYVFRHARSFCGSRGHHSSWLARLGIAKIATVHLFFDAAQSLIRHTQPKLGCAWARLALWKGRGEGEGFVRKSKVCGLSDPSPQSSPCFRGEAVKPDAILWQCAGFINVPEMRLIALLLKRPFHTSVCARFRTRGKHRGNSPSETKVQRHEFDRVVVHGIVWVCSDNGQGRATPEKSVCRKTRLIF